MSSPWKCPHCGTPQAEAARCWSCKRSPLACSTCHDFRRSVAGKLGYCGKDRTRAVLTGDEVRPCWSAPASVEEPPLLGLFESLEPPPSRPARAPRPRVEAPAPVEHAPRVERPIPVEPSFTTRSQPDAPTEPAAPVLSAAPIEPDEPHVANAPQTPDVPRPAIVPVQRGPAPTAAVAARRRWDAIIADVASGAPLGSEPTGGATPSVPHHHVPGTPPVLPWLAAAARVADPDAATPPATATQARAPRPSRSTSTATATPPQGTPAVVDTATNLASPAEAPAFATDEDAYAAWAAAQITATASSATATAPATAPSVEPQRPWSVALPAPTPNVDTPTVDTGTHALPPRTTPAPWTSPMPSESPTWEMTGEDLTPSEPIRWRHRAIDEPAPLPADPSEPAPRRAASLSLIPATLANRLKRHLGTRGPRADATGLTPPAGTPITPSQPSSASLTTPSTRGATPIATNQATPWGRLVEAPPVTGTIMTLGDQLRRAEQLRRERALLDGERLGGERGLDPPA